ncbi:MAG: type IV pilin [Candidatus Aenigmarchaeota archaeon]|nr:type IV pilin [Candidatus Aenigmarchaeota archaeon]
MPKGITPIIAMILLILIVVVLGGAFAAWSLTIGQESMETAEESVQTQTEKMTKSASIDRINSNGEEIYLRNLGSSNITPNEVAVYVDDELWLIDQSASETIKPGKVGTIVFQTKIPRGEHKIKLGTGAFSDIITKTIKGTGSSTYTMTIQDDDGTMEDSVHLDYGDDCARKWIDIPSVTIHSATLRVYGKADDPPYSESHYVKVNDGNKIWFNPNNKFGESYSWASFSIDPSWLNPGTSNDFYFYDGRTDWYKSDLSLAIDKDTDNSRSDWGSNSYTVCGNPDHASGELLIRLEITYS